MPTAYRAVSKLYNGVIADADSIVNKGRLGSYLPVSPHRIFVSARIKNLDFNSRMSWYFYVQRVDLRGDCVSHNIVL